MTILVFQKTFKIDKFVKRIPYGFLLKNTQNCQISKRNPLCFCMKLRNSNSNSPASICWIKGIHHTFVSVFNPALSTLYVKCASKRVRHHKCGKHLSNISVSRKSCSCVFLVFQIICFSEIVTPKSDRPISILFRIHNVIRISQNLILKYKNNAYLSKWASIELRNSVSFNTNKRKAWYSDSGDSFVETTFKGISYSMAVRTQIFIIWNRKFQKRFSNNDSYLICSKFFPAAKNDMNTTLSHNHLYMLWNLPSRFARGINSVLVPVPHPMVQRIILNVVVPTLCAICEVCHFASR